MGAHHPRGSRDFQHDLWFDAAAHALSAALFRDAGADRIGDLAFGPPPAARPVARSTASGRGDHLCRPAVHRRPYRNSEFAARLDVDDLLCLLAERERSYPHGKRDRKSVGVGTRVSVRVVLSRSRTIKKKKKE